MFLTFCVLEIQDVEARMRCTVTTNISDMGTPGGSDDGGGGQQALRNGRYSRDELWVFRLEYLAHGADIESLVNRTARVAHWERGK